MRSERIKGNVLLFTLATQGFETYHLLGHFVVTEDQCIQRTTLVGHAANIVDRAANSNTRHG